MGDSSPITISKKRGILPLVIAEGVVLLLIEGIFFRRKRALCDFGQLKKHKIVSKNS